MSAAHFDPAQRLRELAGMSPQEATAPDRGRQDSPARVHLRDVVPDILRPGSPFAPSFLVGATPGYEGARESGAVSETSGHMGPAAFEALKTDLREAQAAHDPRTRDSRLARAAARVAELVPGTSGEQGSSRANLVREARAQVVFHAKELGKAAGLTDAGSQVVGFGFERALEREGFRVLANHAVERVASAASALAAHAAPTVGVGAGAYRASSASVASFVGMRHQMEQTLTKSMGWLAEHGITKDAVKGVLSRHAGKLTAVIELSQRPEIIERGAQLIAKSPTALKAVEALASDKELRKSVGTLVLATGESVMPASKSAGSLAVVAGAVLRGDSAGDIGRHVFRAAMAVLGGAAGGMAGIAGGPAALATGVIGAELGARLADKVLSVYDRVIGAKPHEQEHLVGHEEVGQSVKTLEARAGAALNGFGHKGLAAGRDAGMEMVRGYKG